MTLKPCPFCGAEPTMHTNVLDDPAWSLVHIRCKKCGVTNGKPLHTVDQAVEWWNTRSSV